ncbi:hypothetical protein FHU10_0592 [Serratia fonticola]|uniref:Uncharacterized protein n=1 Tax=Serratia fonticola TaxID=47917 RepID=A0A542D6C1_SERFO|nr:hypothetical protein [Serratia fonticola]TQI79334.1 hypothetical protein FHU09_1857 [Serratia fonticola]TQI98641.1 hypothetical protein FHU11_4191 [Serratia fonticola]TVZ68168.1 hypothetical protein FHU10_0592 [Serratia fonticola]
MSKRDGSKVDMVGLALSLDGDPEWQEWRSKLVKLMQTYISRIGYHSELYHLNDIMLHLEKIKRKN